MAKKQSDMPAAQVTPLPCAVTFPGVAGAGATTLTSATISVSWSGAAMQLLLVTSNALAEPQCIGLSAGLLADLCLEYELCYVRSKCSWALFIEFPGTASSHTHCPRQTTSSCTHTVSAFHQLGTQMITTSVVCCHQVNATYAGSYNGPMPPRGGTKWLSTGLWAPAGQAITLTISSTVAATLSANGGNLGVQVGSHSDNLSGKGTWCR
jgi:hypothetical protein